MNRFKLVVYWLPVFLWAAVIYSFSSRPTGSVSEIHIGDFLVKKTAHLVEYGFLALLVYRALINSGVDKRKSGYLAVIFAFLYGVSDEFHQSFTPGREPTVRDVIIDTIGASLVIYIVWKRLAGLPKMVVGVAKKFEII